MDPDLLLYQQLAGEHKGMKKIFSRMATERLGAGADREEKRNLSKKLSSKISRLLGGTHNWSVSEERRLIKLVHGHVGTGAITFPWDLWSSNFGKKEGFHLRDKARVLLPEVFGTRDPKCWYGIGTATRCNNTRADKSLTFAFVPNSQKAHTHTHTHTTHITHTYTHEQVITNMGFKSVAWSQWAICCSDHGQDANIPLSPSNLASRTSTPTKGTPSPPSTSRPSTPPSTPRHLVFGTPKNSLTPPTTPVREMPPPTTPVLRSDEARICKRARVAEEADANREAYRLAKECQALERRIALLSADNGGDMFKIVACLLADSDKLSLKVQELTLTKQKDDVRSHTRAHTTHTHTHTHNCSGSA